MRQIMSSDLQNNTTILYYFIKLDEGGEDS